MSDTPTRDSGPQLPTTRVEAAAEALYRLLPAHVRQTDLANSGALRALFGVLGLASAELDAEIQEWHDALFVETAGEAGLAALAALVAAPTLQPVPGEAGIGRRAFVANTIRYRRGKGTARVVEAMAGDVTGLAAVAVEYFQRLARTGHLLDLRPDRPATADLSPGGTAASVGGAFDRLPRLLDVRRVDPMVPGRPVGRHAPTSVGIHLLRPLVTRFPAPAATVDTVPAANVAGVPRARPWPVDGTEHPGYFQLAHQPGAVLRLFNPDRRADAAGTRVQEVDLPDRLRRLPLHQETDELRAAQVEGRAPRLAARRWFDRTGAPFTVFLRRDGESGFRRVPPAQIRIADLESPPDPAGPRPAAEVTHHWYEPGPDTASKRTGTHPLACAVDPVTGRIVVARPAGTPDVVEVRVAGATAAGQALGAGAQDRNTPEEPFDIRDTGGAQDLVWIVDPTETPGGSAQTSGRTVPTLAAALAEVATQGAGQRSLVVLTRCDLETAPAGANSLDVRVPAASEVYVVAAQWRPPRATPGTDDDPALRGFVVRRERRYTVDAPLHVLRGPGAAGAPAGRLVLDGLELTQGLRLKARSVAELHVRYATVRNPGRVAIRADGTLVAARITIDRAICGPVRLGKRMSGELTVTDSVVTADGSQGLTVRTPGLDVTLCNVTVLGVSSLRSLSATNAVFTGPVTVTRRQSGCVRHSFVPADSATPRTFRCQPALALAAAQEAARRPLTTDEARAVRLANEPLFLDTDTDEPTLAMLHPRCPDSVRSGGEGDLEMGAFARAAYGIAVANVRALFEEYLPVVLEAGVIDDTRSGAVAARRNTP